MRSSPPLTVPAVPPTEKTRHEKISRLMSLDLPDDTPAFVLDDIVSYDTRGSYWHLRAERDKRLRLLIRRYVNQIQFGCRNHTCAVPTCLSHRKRNTKVPLRRYTELSARTLATRLVDEYTQQGKDPTSGLCKSDPIVPWYEDPGGGRRRRDAVEGESTRRSTFSLNGHPPEQVSSRTRSLSGLRTQTADAENRNLNSDIDRQEEPGDATRKAALLPSTQETNISKPQSVKHESATANLGAHARHEDKSDSDAVAPTKKTDPASFTQSLWNMFALRKLGRLPEDPKSESNWSSVADSTSQSVATSPVLQQSEDNATSPLEDASKPAFGTGTTFQGFTLRRLRWDTVDWLASMAERNQPVWSNTFEQFVKQSIFYNLSNPPRLLHCLRHWSSSGVRKECGPSELVELVHEGSIAADGDACRKGRKMHLGEARAASKPELDSSRVLYMYNILFHFQPSHEIFDALHVALNKCYELQPLAQSLQAKSITHIQQGTRSADLSPQISTLPTEHHWLRSDDQASDVLVMVLLAACSVFWQRSLSLGLEVDIPDDGVKAGGKATQFLPMLNHNDESSFDSKSWKVAVVDADDRYLLQLLTTLTNNLSHHLAAQAIANAAYKSTARKYKSTLLVENVIQKLCKTSIKDADREAKYKQTLGRSVVELLRTVLLNMWDRDPIIRRTSPVGGALELLSGLYRRRVTLGLEPPIFFMQFIAEAFDEMEMPSAWLSFRPDGREVHILTFTFLFDTATLVKYFRSVNIETMRKSHEAASIIFNDARQFLGSSTIPVYGGKEVLASMRPYMAKYFVLTIRRSEVLSDAINQIWRRQRRELMRPLRVRLGKDEGEDGLDHGGVQQEFFRLALAEALQPEYGMFTVDDRTRMTWFQPGSLEPLYKFETLGVLMSLAVYNAVTLPVTFPLALYRKLLDLRVKKLEHIVDGWPDLTKGLQFLLDWTNGDVGDVISRTYEFSYDFLGTPVTIDMLKVGRDDPWPPTERSKKGKEKAKSTSFELPVPVNLTPPSHSPPTEPLRSRHSSFRGISTPASAESEALDEPATVTNENRERYVKDYILWLTDKSVRPQYEAFARGFFTCLDPTALTLFTPEALKNVVEGHREIDIDELEKTASYQDYDKTSQTVRDFWEVMRNYSPGQHRQLLEFVTASDRIPVNGISSIQFIVQKNGDDDARLPSSSTCYGRLLLPQYSSKAILEEKLTKAIENSLGFGSL